VRLVINIPKVQEYMNFKGWDEKQLADEMGVSYVTVYRVFRGKRDPGNEFIAKLLSACKGAEFDQLFIFDKSLPKGNEGEEESIGDESATKRKSFDPNTC
jgi:transcriptional regulator with XRE-family HTH domain